MLSKNNELPQDIYRRIYRLGHQKVDPRIIAAALKLPLKTVMSVLDRFFAESDTTIKEVDPKIVAADIDAGILSVFVFSKIRYSVMDLGGKLEGDNPAILREELQKQLNTPVKALAMRLADVDSMDESGVDVLNWAKAAFTAKGRFIGILDPSVSIEKQLIHHGLDQRIPIFGTESAFEEKAFANTSIKSENKKTRL